MARKIAKGISGGAFQWHGETYYWVKDSKGNKYTKINKRGWEAINKIAQKTHDLSRLENKLQNYTLEGRYEAKLRMRESFESLLNFRYGEDAKLTQRFRDAFEEMSDEEWANFVEQNEEYFNEYWNFYNSGAFTPYSTVSDKAGLNAKIKREGTNSLKAIVEAMEKTALSGKVKVITKTLKDYKEFQ